MRLVLFLEFVLLSMTVETTMLEYQAIMRLRLTRSNKLVEYKLNDIVVIECGIVEHSMMQSTINKSDTLFHWFKNGNRLCPTGRRTRFIDNKLVIKRLLKIDQGVYYCQIGAQPVYTSPSLTLRFNEKVSESIEVDLNDETDTKRNVAPSQLEFETTSRHRDLLEIKQEGGSIELDCRTKQSSQRPHILWYKNENLIGDDDPRLVLNSSSMSLNVRDIRMNDSGTYKCQVFNQHGELSKNFRLAVTHKTVNNVTASSNETIILDCDIDRDRGFSHRVKWYANLVYYDNLDRPKLRIDDKIYSRLDRSPNMMIYSSNGSLLIRRLTFLNTGVYFCTVNDSIVSRNRIYLTESDQISATKTPVLVQQASTSRSSNPAWHEFMLAHPVYLILAVIIFVCLVVLLVLGCLYAFRSCKKSYREDEMPIGHDNKAFFVRHNPTGRQSRSVHMRGASVLDRSSHYHRSSNKRLSFHEASLYRDAYFGRTRRYSSVVMTAMPSNLHNTAFANGTYESEMSMSRDMLYQQIPRSKSNYQVFNIPFEDKRERFLPQIIV